MQPPDYRLEVEPLDLGAEGKAVSLELIERESGEPLRGADAARIWSAVLPAVAAQGAWALDFCRHLAGLRDYCQQHGIAYREAAERSIVIAALEAEPLAALFERFEGETFGMRSGSALHTGDPAVEGELARRGVDAYHH